MGRLMNAMIVAATLLLMTAAGALAQRGCMPANARPSLGIGMFHCQGGTCMVHGASATMDESIPQQARAMREANARAWWFSVEPRLYQISGPAQGFVHDADILVAVNGSPITTRAAGMVLAEMQAGTPVRLTLRRDGILLEDEVVPEAGCAQVRVSAGPEVAPAGMAVMPGGAGGRGGRGRGRGGASTTQRVPITVVDGNVVTRQDVTVAVRDTTVVVKSPLYVVDGVIVTRQPTTGGGRGGRGGRASGTSTAGRARIEASGLVLSGDKAITVDPNGAVRWWFTAQPSVVEVVPGSAAARAGIAAGDVIQSAGNRALTTAEGVAALAGARAGSPVMVTVRRGSSVLNLELYGG